MRKLTTGAFLVLFGLVVGFLILEMVFRMTVGTYYYVIDKQTGLPLLPPNSSFVLKKSCFSNRVVVNSWGFHAPEFLTTPRPREFRIVVVGDSFVEALQVSRSKTAYMLLEKMLNRKFGPNVHVTVYPIGIAGNGTYANYLYYQYYGEKLKPNLVIDMFCTENDVRDDSRALGEETLKQIWFPLHTIRGYPRFDPSGNLLPHVIPRETLKMKLKDLARHSAAFMFLYHKLEILRSDWIHREALHGGEMPIFAQECLKHYPPVWKQGWQIEKKLFADFKREAEKNGARFMVVSGTESYRVDPSMLSPSLAGILDSEKPEKELTKISKDLNIPYLPLLFYFRKMHQEKKIPETFPCDGHWNETGHRWVAEDLFHYLISHPETVGLNAFVHAKKNLLDRVDGISLKR